MILRLICVLVFLLLPFSFQNAFTTAAEFRSEVVQVIDLLGTNPGNPLLKRACMLQIEGSNVPCDTVWYVGLKTARSRFSLIGEAGTIQSFRFSGSTGT